MSHPSVRNLLAAALACSLFALSAAWCVARADQPTEAIKSDAHHLAVDVNRKAHDVGHQVSRDAHQMGHDMAATRDRVSQQMHHLGQRIQRWWSHVRQS